MSDTTTLAEGLYFGEGPRWHGGRLWFSDFYAHAVKSVDEAGVVRTELELDDQPSGLGWLPDGRLLVVAMKARAVRRLDAGGLALHADISHLTAHLCNDMVVDAQGSAWVGNFGFDLDGELRSRGMEVLNDHPTTNLVRVDPDGSVHLAAADMHFPNGSVITPDGRTLIVAETLASRLTAFTINADRSLSGRRVWAAVPGVAPDGICLNDNNQVWVANAIGPEAILVAAGGDIVQRVATTQPCYACMLGGRDGKTLFRRHRAVL
ncbi:MAG: SMP-30/gluconolactonase/LRE family protein [Halioglobus sp.]